jgi:hypothetical protein
MRELMVIAIVGDLNIAEGDPDLRTLSCTEIKDYLVDQIDADQGVKDIRVWRRAAPHIMQMLPRSER